MGGAAGGTMGGTMGGAAGGKVGGTVGGVVGTRIAGARMLPPEVDPIQPAATTPVTITVDGVALTGLSGQSIAGVLMARDQLQLRRTASGDRPRGVFCGIGVCFDCLVEVNGVQDVRACQRKAHDGDVVNTVQSTEATQRTGAAQSEEATQRTDTAQHPEKSEGGAA